MKLFLGVLVLAKVGIFVAKQVESVNKFVKNCLLAICVMQERQEFVLDVESSGNNLLTLKTEILKDFLHLPLVVHREFIPKLDNNWLEVVVNALPNELCGW